MMFPETAHFSGRVVHGDYKLNYDIGYLADKSRTKIAYINIDDIDYYAIKDHIETTLNVIIDSLDEDLLAHAVPEIEKIISTEQFKLSEELLDLRFALGLSFYETAKWLNLDPRVYIKYEYADTDLSPDDYQAIIDKLKTYQKDKPTCSNN